MSETARIWIRRITWLAMAATLLIIGVIAVGRSRGLRPRVVQVTSPGTEAGDTTEGRPVGVYTGFQFTESLEGRTVFILQAERTLGLSSGWNRIENVRLVLFDEDGEQVELTCDQARFNQKTRDARLEGAVHVELPGGGFLDSEAGRFDGTRQTFESGAGVVFSNGLLVGEAGRAVYRLSSDTLTLKGGLVVGEQTGMTLRAPSMEYSRRNGKAVFPEGWTLSGPDMTVSAPFAAVELEEQEGAPKRLDMKGGVVFTLHDAGEAGGSVTLRAEGVRAIRDEGDHWQVRAFTTASWVELQAVDMGDLEQVLVRSWEVRAVVGPGGPVRATFRGKVCVEIYPVSGLPGSGEANRLILWFEKGHPRSFEMNGDVLIRNEGYRARGAAARFLPSGAKAIVRGNAETFERAVIDDGEGLHVEANRVEFLQSEGSARASGDVQGVMEDATLLRRSGSGGQEPVRFAAEVLNITERGELVRLRRSSRVWQGRQLLMADEITFRKSAEILDAVGHVRMSVPANQFDPDAAAGEEALIVARSLHYDRQAGRILFEGAVRFTDPRYTMSCARMEATIGRDDDRVKSLDAAGSVDILDLVEDRRMRGEEAHYDAESRTLTMTGSPVNLLDGKGNVISGTSLTWDQASGTVSVSGEAGSPTETIYHPEETAETPGT